MKSLNLTGAPNARDLGGIVTTLGTVKHGKLVRSGELSRLTPGDVEILQRLPLARVVDLRTDTEKELSPDVVIPNVRYESVSIIRATTFGITYEKSSGAEIAEMLKAGFARMQQRNETYSMHMEILYRKFVNDEHSRKGYGQFLKLLANEPTEGATLWHCTMGKDRVGTCTALLLHCLGATEEQIFEDYLLTNELTKANREFILNKVRGFVSEESLKMVENMLLANRSYLENFYEEIRCQFGTVDDFVEACGVNKSEIDALQKIYLA